MLLALINNYSIRHIDFVLAYPQAEIECNLHKKLLAGFETAKGNSRSYVLLIKCNLRGQKQADRVWNKHLVKGLKKIGFEPSKVDESVFYRGNTIFFCS